MIRKWTDDRRGWRKRFAIMPIFLSNGRDRTFIWLRWHWRRDMCLYTEISEVDPNA